MAERTAACEELVVRGPRKGLPATGTDAGYQRHRRAGEEPCEECQAARSAALRQWKVDHPGADTARKQRWRESNRERDREWSAQYRDRNRPRIRANQKRYFDRHRERIRESWRRWYESDPEHVAQVRRAYYVANREKMAAQQRARRERDPERFRETNRRWRERHPDQARAQARNQGGRRRAAIRAGTIVRFTLEQLNARMAFYGHRCWMCRGEATEIDHVKPLAAGGAHCLANLRPACRSCNRAKGAQWPFP